MLVLEGALSRQGQVRLVPIDGLECPSRGLYDAVVACRCDQGSTSEMLLASALAMTSIANTTSAARVPPAASRARAPAPRMGGDERTRKGEQPGGPQPE